MVFHTKGMCSFGKLFHEHLLQFVKCFPIRVLIKKIKIREQYSGSVCNKNGVRTVTVLTQYDGHF
jgi:hypothetical protein